ncbi:MAG TPA: immunoglobulin domain-containing protein [Opitutaceae bacterium]|nr:immunoglobulin domain-containing protein [Opitutaceae bacterium]
MNSSSVGLELPVQRWSRLARRLVALATVGLGLTGAYAQKVVVAFVGANGSPGYTNDTGNLAQFRFATPSGIAVDAAGNAYVTDSLNNAVRRISSTGVVTTFAGSLTGANGSANGLGTAALFNVPQGIAIDGAGNLYVADTGNQTIRMITPGGLVSTLAGTAGATGYVNSTGPAAQFRSPLGVAADRAGAGGAAVNVYVADTQNNVIRKIVVASGVVTTYAGALPVGNSSAPSGSLDGQDNVPQFNSPAGITSDPSGLVVYVADTANNSIRRLISDGTTVLVSTPVGSPFPGYAEGTGAGAAFNAPNAIATDIGGNLLVTDTLNQVVRMITSTSTSLFAGTPTVAGSLDGVAVNGAQFNRPTGIAVDSLNNVYVVDTLNSTVRKVINAGTPFIALHPVGQTVELGATVVLSGSATGTPNPTYQWQRFRVGDTAFTNIPEGNGYTGTQTATLTITPVAAAMAGDLYQLVATNAVGSATTNTAQLTVNLGPVFTTWLGRAGQPGSVDGSGNAARFRAPGNVAIDSAGNAYIADSANNIIRKVTPAGVVTTLAGLAGSGGIADGFASTARFNGPTGIAVDAAGNIYVADTGNHTIRLINAVGVVVTLAGTGGAQGSTDGAGAAARFAFPTALAVDSTGLIYVADTLNNTIRKVTNLGVVTTFVGTAGQSGTLDATGTAARFFLPSGVAVDSAFNVYVGDTGNNTIRKVTSAGVVTTFAGLANSTGSADGLQSVARFNQPHAVALDTSGNVYVADTGNHTIRRISPAGLVVTMAGVAGVSGSLDGVATNARFFSPNGISLDSTNTIYVSDTQNHIIRKTGLGSPVEILAQPQAQRAAVGGTVSFTVNAIGSPSPSYQWQRRIAGSSDFANISNDTNFSGVTSATLTVTGITAAMNGDEFRVVTNNSLTSGLVSDAASLTVVAAPTFTSANNATFRVGESNSFNVTVNASGTVTYSATGLPSWASINSSTGVISGTPPNATGSPFAVTITANNGTGNSTAVNQIFTLRVIAADAPPIFSTQPVAVTVNRGDGPTLTVAATGGGTLTYQWLKDGAIINGASSASYTVPNAQTSATYSVRVSNAFGTVTSNAVAVTVLTSPIIAGQPRTQIAQVGTAATFATSVTGNGLTYQWRKNGVNIAGATTAVYTIGSVTAADAGNYDVIITNTLGAVLSSMAQLVVVTAPTAPVFTLQPATRIAAVGNNVTLSASAAGAPSPTYQWRKNGVAIAGATGATLTLNNVSAGDAAVYEVVATNSVGSVTSTSAILNVIARSYGGTYFGSFAGGLGNFALMVRDDNTGVFLGYLPGSTAAIVSQSINVNDAGQFSFSQAATTGTPAFAAVAVSGTIGTDGNVTGSVVGGANTGFTATRAAATGSTTALAGFYSAGSANNAGTAYTIVSPTGQAFVVVQSGTTTDGGSTTVSSSGQISIATGRSTITETITPATGAVAVTVVGAITANFNGASEAVLAPQRLANISSRARVTGGAGVAIAGFVISGAESKPVLIRAVGPGLAAFGVPGTLASPTLELYRGSTLLERNAGVSTSTNAAGIAAAGVQAGAFALAAAGTDSAILTTLPPGNYTAVVNSAVNAQGVALIEVYDLSAPAAGQKLLNISTRANAGTGADVLTAGVVVTGTVPKRVLIRGIGPGLAQLGLTGVLTNPTLTLIKDGVTVASNTGFGTSADAAAISAASVQVGAFAMVAADSAMIVSLAPGNYTAQVTSSTGATGVAIVEVYELP